MMNWIGSQGWFVAAFLASTMGATSSVAEEFVVGSGGITTIQEAVDAALLNVDTVDTILIPAGDYTETVLVDYGASGQEGLTIQRKGKKGKVNIVGATGTAITIRAAVNVVLKKLTLMSASSGDAVSALRIDMASKNVVCQKVNGVEGDDFGVVIAGASNIGCRFENCDFSGMLGAGFTLDGVGHELDGCKADACGLNGVVFTVDALLCEMNDTQAIATGGGSNTLQPGYVTVRGNGHRIVNSTVGGASGDGVWITGNGNIVIGTDSSDNVGIGFHLDDSSILVQDSFASGNSTGLDGGGLTATIDGGKFNGNMTHGIHVTEGGTTILDVKCNANGMNGIDVAVGADGNKLRGCSVAKNVGSGIVINGSLTFVSSCEANKGNSIVDNGTGNGGRDNVVSGSGTNEL